MAAPIEQIHQNVNQLESGRVQRCRTWGGRTVTVCCPFIVTAILSAGVTISLLSFTIDMLRIGGTFNEQQSCRRLVSELSGLYPIVSGVIITGSTILGASLRRVNINPIQ